MAQNIYYNPDFTDADADTLCQVASIANHPQHRYYTCGWVTGGAICSSFVQGPDFPDHLRSYHGIVASDKTKLRCCWTGCVTELKKESLMRHVNEKHLEWRYGCPSCPEQFTRPHTMQMHFSSKHSGN